MFTGLIELQGEVVSNLQMGSGNRLVVKSSFEVLNCGESIAVNGVCLTLLPGDNELLHFDVSPETLTKTNLGNLQPGSFVNLERALEAHSRLGGHYVSGHVDTTATLQSIIKNGEYIEFSVNKFECGKNAMLYLIPKGSITLDGISLTINSVENNTIKLMLVPHTLAVTTLGYLTKGYRFNVEFDYLTRIVAHQLSITGQLNNEVFS